MMGKKTASVSVEFGPPPPTRRDYQWPAVAEQLRKRPGEWAVVARDLPASVAGAIRAGRVNAVANRLGFVTRTTGNHRDENGKQWCRELHMMYDPEADLTRAAKKNGGKK